MSILYIVIGTLVCAAVILALYFLVWARQSEKLEKLEGLIIKYSSNNIANRESFENSTSEQDSYRLLNLDEQQRELYQDLRYLLPQKYLQKIKCNGVTSYMLDCVINQVARDDAVNIDTLSAITMLLGWLYTGVDAFTYDRQTKVLTKPSGWPNGKTTITLKELHEILKKRMAAEKSTISNYPNIDCLCQPSS